MLSIRLIAFAHRGEARAFLSEFSCRPSPLKENLFQSESKLLYILISGEGPYRAMSEMALTLGLLKAQYPQALTTVYNFGICGSLEDGQANQFAIGDITQIRTIYSNSANQGMEFKSFTAPALQDDKRHDLVSSHIRVLSKETRVKLSHFAPLVDREAWGFAYACQSANLKLNCFKLISDHADGEICQIVKEQAPEWSESLLEKFNTLEEKKDEPNPSPLPGELNAQHITVSQKRRLINLFRALHLKGIPSDEALKLCHFDLLKGQKKRSKEITKELIQKLHALVYPLNTALDEKLQEQVAPLKAAGLQVRFDQDLERELLHIGATISSKEQIAKIQSSFDQFNFDHYISLLRGQDVQ